MGFARGVIVGAALVVLGAYIHDTMEPGLTKPLVNWPRAAELQQTTYDYLREQYDRLNNWLNSRLSGGSGGFRYDVGKLNHPVSPNSEQVGLRRQSHPQERRNIMFRKLTLAFVAAAATRSPPFMDVNAIDCRHSCAVHGCRNATPLPSRPSAQLPSAQWLAGRGPRRL
jgi:hypothetical protein